MGGYQSQDVTSLHHKSALKRIIPFPWNNTHVLPLRQESFHPAPRTLKPKPPKKPKASQELLGCNSSCLNMVKTPRLRHVCHELELRASPTSFCFPSSSETCAKVGLKTRSTSDQVGPGGWEKSWAKVDAPVAKSKWLLFTWDLPIQGLSSIYSMYILVYMYNMLQYTKHMGLKRNAHTVFTWMLVQQLTLSTDSALQQINK